jgi:hypothetical protein
VPLFVVSESRKPCAHCDAYVLPLGDPNDVADARALIAQGPASGVGSIAVARIAAGADGVNRNPLAPGAPAWSWHVTSFEAFADAAIELCDGWPGYVESDVPGWIANTNGTICFWSYTVTAELPQIGSSGELVAALLFGALVTRFARAAGLRWGAPRRSATARAR